MARRGPGGPVPPTLVYVAGLAAGYWLDLYRTFPVDGAGPKPAQIAAGVFMIGVGTWLFMWGLATFFRSSTGIMLQQSASTVVDAGPYRFSRNPMYVGLTVGYVGVALVINVAWPIVLLPVVLVAVTMAVIAREERYMLARFGPAYEAYCARVRRWL